MKVLLHHVDDDGVSPIIACILMVAMTVILVGIISAVFVGMSNVPASVPVVGLSIEKSGTDILVHHQNGDVLPEGKYAVLIDGNEIMPSGDFTPGMTLNIPGFGTNAGTVIVVYKDGSGSTMLAQKIFGGAGSAGSEVISIGGKNYVFTRGFYDWDIMKTDPEISPIGSGTVLRDDGRYWSSTKWCDHYDYNTEESISDAFKVAAGLFEFSESSISNALTNENYESREEVSVGSFFIDANGNIYIYICGPLVEGGDRPPLPPNTHWRHIATRI